MSRDLPIVNRDVFANNRLSLVIRTTCDAGYLARSVGGISPPALNVFFDALCDPEYGPSHDPGKTAFLYAMKQKGFPAASNAFEILAMNVSHPWHHKSAVCHIAFFQEEQNNVNLALTVRFIPTYSPDFPQVYGWCWRGLRLTFHYSP